MVGVLLIGFVIYKKTMMTGKNDNKGMIKVLDSISIAPKKTLLVVRVKNEKFLIASDSERTTFLSKLSEDNQQSKQTKKAEEPSEMIFEEDLLKSLEKNHETKKVQNFEQQRLNEIQKQFNELYEKDEIAPKINKKEMIKALIRDLEQTKAM